MYRIAIFIIRPEPEPDICNSVKPSQLTVIQYESKIRNTTKMFNPLNSLVCSCITPYSNLIRLALYFKKINLSALSGSSHARCSVMTPPAVLKRRSEGTKRTEHYLAEISGTWYHFGRNRSRNRIRKNRNRSLISGTSLLNTVYTTAPWQRGTDYHQDFFSALPLMQFR